MDLNQINYFLTVADKKSVTKAAKELYVTQPSLSRSITAIEDEAGVRLFDRTSRPLSLTYAGERYYEAAVEIRLLCDNLKKQLEEINDCNVGRIMVGIPPERAACILPELLTGYEKLYPGIEIVTVESKSSALEECLARGQVDFIVFPEMSGYIDNSWMECQHLCEEEIVLVAGEGVITQNRCIDGFSQTVDPALLEDLPFVLLKEGHGMRRKAEAFFKETHIQPRIAFETGSNLAAIRLASAGVGVALMPRITARMLADSLRINIFSIGRQHLTWSVVSAHRRGAYQNKAKKDLLQMIYAIMNRENAQK